MTNIINSVISNKLTVVSLTILLASFCQSAISAQMTNEQRSQLVKSAKENIELSMPKVIAEVSAQNNTSITTSQSKTLATLLLSISSK